MTPPRTEDTSAEKRAPLTRDAVLRAALEMVDELGLEKLSMRQLAGRLGVEAMSLYHHVANKDDLLTGIVERVLTEMDLPEPLPEDWMGLIEAMLLSFRRVLAKHPNTVPLLMTRPLATPTTTGYVEAPLQVLGGAGFTAAQAGELYQTAIAYTIGHALISGLDPATPEDAPIRSSDAAEKYPGIVGSDIRPWEFDEAGYVRAVRVIVNGFAELFRAESEPIGGSD